MGLKLDWEWNGGHGVATVGGLRLQVQNEYHPVTWWVRTQPWGDHHEVEVIGDDWRAATLAAQESAEAAAARLLAEDAGVRALLAARGSADDAEHLAAWLRFADGLRRYWHAHPSDHGLRVTVGGESVDVTMQTVFAITEMAQQAAALEAALRWIPVTERLPDEGARVLVACEGDTDEPYIMTLRRSAVMDGGYYWEDDAGAGGAVLHPSDRWRPLPPGPEVGQ